MNKHRKFELHAGIFINIGLALCMLALLVFGNSLNIFSRTATYHFTLPNAQGLIPGAKVLIAGLSAGKVSQMTLDNRTREINVQIQIDPQYRPSIRADSFVDLTTQGILGDKVVMIEPGTQSQQAIPEGGTVPVQVSSDLNQLLRKGNHLIDHLDLLIVRVSDVINGFGGGHAGKRIAQEAVGLLKNLNEISYKLATEVDPSKIDGALAKLNNILGKIDDGKGTVGALINDPQLYDDAKSLAGEANDNRIVRNLVRKSINDADAKTQKEREAQEAGQAGEE
jgi:phospholipid/cholesterol/gamma-HCH transport system substrate-binding protein